MDPALSKHALLSVGAPQSSRIGVSAGDARVGVGKAGNRACGAALRVRLVVEGPNERISAFSVESIGHSLEEAQAFSPLLLGRTVTEALQIPPRELARRVGGLPDAKMYCSVLLHEALRSAVAEVRGEARDAEGTLTCTCYAVSEKLLRRAIVMNGLTNVQEVRCFTKAGGGCGCCLSRVADVISSVAAELTNEKSPIELPANDERAVPLCTSCPPTRGASA